MSTEENLLLEREARRKRIERMKSCIVSVIVFWMIFSMLAIILLSVQTVSLSNRVKKLQETIEKQLVDDVISNSTEKSSENTKEDEEESGTEESSEAGEPAGDQITGRENGIDSPENMAQEGDTHYVYLTFDAGPSQNTQQILDILNHYQVKATFFVTGTEDESMRDIYRRIVADGHTLGMHSYSNQYSKVYASTDAFYNDYKKLSDYLYKVTGLRCQYYRFPGGSGNEVSNVDMTEFIRILNDEKVTYFDWNVAAADTAADSSAEDVVSSVINGVASYKTSVILLHDEDDKAVTVEALGELIEALQEMQAEILPIDENTDVIQYVKADSVK